MHTHSHTHMHSNNAPLVGFILSVFITIVIYVCMFFRFYPWSRHLSGDRCLSVNGWKIQPRYGNRLKAPQQYLSTTKHFNIPVCIGARSLSKVEQFKTVSEILFQDVSYLMLNYHIHVWILHHLFIIIRIWIISFGFSPFPSPIPCFVSVKWEKWTGT
jgi:hypothetical protein